MIEVQWSDWIHVRRGKKNSFGKENREREKKQNITQLENLRFFLKSQKSET